jgi:hypothetical protein
VSASSSAEAGPSLRSDIGELLNDALIAHGVRTENLNPDVTVVGTAEEHV